MAKGECRRKRDTVPFTLVARLSRWDGRLPAVVVGVATVVCGLCRCCVYNIHWYSPCGARDSSRKQNTHRAYLIHGLLEIGVSLTANLHNDGALIPGDFRLRQVSG